MYKFIAIICLPFLLYGASGELLHVVDGDTAVFKTKKENIICHMGAIDTPEITFNNKLKKEIKECAFSKTEFIKAGKLSHDYAKTLLKVGQTYKYEVLGETRSKNHICKIILPKGLHVELRPTMDELMIARGYALPYVINSSKEETKLLLKIAKDAKIQKLGL